MTRIREFLVGLAVASTALALPISAYASHSMPIIPQFWDLDNDGVPEASDSGILWNKRGTDWTSTHTTRANEAFIAWSSQTDWNPAISSALQVNDIWIDGTQPNQSTGSHCPTNKDSWAELGSVGAVNCIYRGERRNGGPNPLYGYYRMQDSDIFLNSDNITFNWGTTQVGSPSARGVLTHEVGHGIYLIDVPVSGCGSPMITMCGAGDAAATWQLFSLTSDDIAAANFTYLP